MSTKPDKLFDRRRGERRHQWLHAERRFSHGRRALQPDFCCGEFCERLAIDNHDFRDFGDPMEKIDRSYPNAPDFDRFGRPLKQGS